MNSRLFILITMVILLSTSGLISACKPVPPKGEITKPIPAKEINNESIISDLDTGSVAEIGLVPQDSLEINLNADFSFTTGEESTESESVMEDIDTSFFPGINNPARELRFEEMSEMSAKEIDALRDFKIPIMKTYHLQTIPYPFLRARLQEPHLAIPFYCSNDYMIGTMLTLDLEWIQSQREDCRPSGTFKETRISGEQLIRWLEEWNRGAPARESIIDEMKE